MHYERFEVFYTLNTNIFKIVIFLNDRIETKICSIFIHIYIHYLFQEI